MPLFGLGSIFNCNNNVDDDKQEMEKLDRKIEQLFIKLDMIERSLMSEIKRVEDILNMKYETLSLDKKNDIA